MNAPVVDLSFEHAWDADVLSTPPPILPARHFIYPRDAEEVERGALQVMVRPRAIDPANAAQPFLATCALGFRDPAVPTGVWSAPDPHRMCAVAGGYAYVIDTAAPERFSMIAYRPVLQVRALPQERLLLFVGHRSILAWGNAGQAWESEKLSDEGVTITAIENGVLRGTGWQMMADTETAFAIDLGTGRRAT